MLARIVKHLREWAGVLALVLVLTGGVAYAANTVFSSDIVDGEVKTPDIASNAVASGKIGNNQVFSDDVRDDTLPNGGLGGVDIANDSLKGPDIAEATLENVNARTVRGLQVRKINFQVPYGTGPTTVLDLAGLQITAECQNFGDVLDVKAFTSKNDASVYFAAISSSAASDADAIQDIASDRFPDGLFDVGLQLQIDNETAPIGDDAMGTLHYSAPDGSVVVAHLALDRLNAGGCALTGMAIGG